MIHYGLGMIDIRPDEFVWEAIAAELRRRIEAGTYRPGFPIPSETTLVQEFGCSRGTARRVVEALRDEGLIYTVPRKGSFVAQK